MRIAILSREAKNYSTQRICEACLRRGHKVDVLDTMKFSILVEKGKPSLHYEGKRIKKYDAVIPRIGASITFFGSAVVRQFEQMGIFSLNTALAITISRDKLRAIQVLSRYNIGIPTTAFVKHKETVTDAMDFVGGEPVVVKLLEGTQGVGVILADTKQTAKAILETLHGVKQNVLVQRFVSESKGRDIRAFVVGGEVVAAMRRVAQKGEFRSNVHRGGKVEKVKLKAEYRAAAIKAAQVMGLNVAGVDMLEGAKGPLLMEVNSSPGLEGIEAASKVNVADAMVEYLEQRVLFPDVDIRQRLTLKSGYGVVEIRVDAKSVLRDKKLNETQLREKDVSVLSLSRGTITIPNPKGTREILKGDRLLCFGKLEAMRNLLPAKKIRKIPKK